MKKTILTIVLAVLTFGSLSAQAVQTGSIVAWGYNNYSQCNVPTATNSGFVAIAGGVQHSLGLKEDGSVAGWGDIYYGQCNVPAPNSGFTTVAAGGYYSLGLKDDGSVAAWGYNGYGQCNVPAPNSGFIATAAGWGHSLGLKDYGSVVGWGNNHNWNGNIYFGQATPPDANDFIAVAAGLYHSLGLKEDGSVAAWGRNNYGQCNVPAPNSGFVAIAAGWDHNLGLKEDGSVTAWGWNDAGRCNVPAPNSGFVAISAGGSHSLGLKYDGSVVSWGENGYGQCNVPSPNSDFIAIAAGFCHSLALAAEPTMPPVADADGPYSINVGDTLTLDGSSSTDADDDITSYMWDLDDDGTFETDAGGQAILTVDYAYLESLGFIVGGPYDIYVQVTDSQQQSDTDSSTLTITPPPVIEAVVDIKPGSCPNPLNVKSRGVVPVAILGSAALDVTTIDAGSIFLNGARNVRSGYEDVAGFIADANDCECTTLGGDGYLDLTLKFMTQDIVKTFGEVNHGDILTLPLAGFLFDEIPVEGADCVVIRGKHKPINKADINKDGVVNMADVVMVAENWLQSSIVED